jgi:DNA-binding transcriptional LysR family regulator
MRNLHYITTFLLLAELNNFSQAAKKLNLSTTAVSKQIKALEEEMGEQLFIRTTRKVELTEFGQAFLVECEALVDKVDQIEEFIAARKSVPQGTLHIVCAFSLGHDLLMTHLAKFNELYPDIKLNIEFSENTTGLDQAYGDIHFAYGEHPGVTDDMRYQKLFSVRHKLVAAPCYLQQHEAINSASDLHGHCFMNLNLRKPLDSFTLASGELVLTPKPNIIMNNFSSLTQACVEGMGITLSADLFVDELIEKGQLVPVLPDLDYRSLEVFLFYRATKYELPKVKVFVDFYREQALVEGL